LAKIYKMSIRPAQRYDGPELDHAPWGDLMRVHLTFPGLEFSGFRINPDDLEMLLDDVYRDKPRPSNVWQDERHLLHPAHWEVEVDGKLSRGWVYFIPKKTVAESVK